MSPASDLKPMGTPETVDHAFNVFRQMAEGKLTTGNDDEYKADMMSASKELNPMDKVASIKAPLMVIVGSKDDITTPDVCKQLYEKATSDKEWVLTEGADHSYTEHRLSLQKSVLDWLDRKL